MLITAEQRTELESLIELASHGRALRHEHDNPSQASALKDLVSQHRELETRKTDAAEVVEKLRTEVAQHAAAIEIQNGQIKKKTVELNDGTGLTSRDLVNLQGEISGHEERVAELEETELGSMEELESAEAALSDVESSLAEVTAAGRTTQAAIKDRKAELAAELEANSASAQKLKADLPEALVQRFDQNIAAGGPGAAVLNGPNCQACGQEISGMAWKSMLLEDPNQTYECQECEAVLLRKG
ncbi:MULTISPECIES: zinc ribbon domain-containing protein [Brevibacterium]|uniref:CT398-like coiled coil hairpin domain-containing protein n=2 Tax=Brevibacterium antiquum TaxID=234835 RepID=A0A2H1HS99_9MICO|nr:MULTISPECIES: hypothetical protein [Brevibacterium]SMX65813.1 hypothetical protein BANT918_00406 [Brevibacterium antiquum CNRZ 918]SMX66522.1 hypothetical protein BANT10_00402 [Brevibacterium antiquum]HCG56240.1 hypothetical protein [Brevibacterium sp.]